MGSFNHDLPGINEELNKHFKLCRVGIFNGQLSARGSASLLYFKSTIFKIIHL